MISLMKKNYMVVNMVSRTEKNILMEKNVHSLDT